MCAVKLPLMIEKSCLHNTFVSLYRLSSIYTLRVASLTSGRAFLKRRYAGVLMQPRLVVFTFRCYPYSASGKEGSVLNTLSQREYGDKLTLPHSALVKLTAAGASYPLVLRVARAKPRYYDLPSDAEDGDATDGYLDDDGDDWVEDLGPEGDADADAFDDITGSGLFDPANQSTAARRPGVALACMHGAISDLSTFEPVAPRVLHCGVHDFTAPDGTAYLPQWVMVRNSPSTERSYYRPNKRQRMLTLSNGAICLF
jgi:hypothetical protein